MAQNYKDYLNVVRAKQPESGTTPPEVSTNTLYSTKFTESDTAPLDPVAGDRWFDTTEAVLYTAATDDVGIVWVQMGQ